MATEEAGSTDMTGYIQHHLHHWQVSVGDSAFMTINVDTLMFSLVCAVVFMFLFVLLARRATPGVPGKLQCVVEMIVGFVDGLVRETFHGRSKLIGPLSLTIFGLIFFMNFLDLIRRSGAVVGPTRGTGGDPAHAYCASCRPPTNTTLGMALTVFW